MQYKYLKDRYIATIGALPTAYSLSRADLQVALGLKVKDLIDIVGATNSTRTVDDAENLTDTIVIQGQFIPNEVLSGQDNTAGTTATTASFTPHNLNPTARLYYIIINGFPTTAGTGADPTSVVCNANGAAFTKLVGANTTNGNCNLSIWAIDASTISGAGTITITYAASQNTIQWKLHEYIGTKITGTAGFGGRKQAIVTAVNATTTPSVTLGSAPNSADIVICAIAYNASNANSIVAGTGATLVGAVIQAGSDAAQLAVEFDTLPTNLQTLGFTTGNASGKVLAIVELEAA